MNLAKESVILFIRKKSIINNYQQIIIKTKDNARSTAVEVWPVIKADGYGIGANIVARCLINEAKPKGFFVANLNEALALKKFVSEFKLEVKKEDLKIEIAIFSPLSKEEMELSLAKAITPCLNSIAEIETYNNIEIQDKAKPFLHIDTGMSRLGLDHSEIDFLEKEPKILLQSKCEVVLSHLASAEDKHSKMNPQQKKVFDNFVAKVTPKFKNKPKLSLSASAGAYLDKSYHYDMVRPGIALYGGRVDDQQQVFPVIELQAKILQVRKVKQGDTVGYNCSFQASNDSIIATLGIGYADGCLRNYANCMENKSTVSFFHKELNKTDTYPIVGITSMDYITIDITNSSKIENLSVGSYVNLIDKQTDINKIARMSSTIPYEILTNLKFNQNRVKRIIIDD